MSKTIEYLKDYLAMYIIGSMTVMKIILFFCEN